MNSNIEQGELFSDSLLTEIKEKFYHVEFDPIQNKKEYFSIILVALFDLKQQLINSNN